MAARGEVVLEVSFGPSTSSYLARAVALAKRYAEHVAEEEPGAWRATYHLSADERDYGRALQLLMLVGGWRTTTVEVGGSVEPAQVPQLMLSCSREWLLRAGRCREHFPAPFGWPKCRICPLYDRVPRQESETVLALFSLEPGAHSEALR